MAELQGEIDGKQKLIQMQREQKLKDAAQRAAEQKKLEEDERAEASVKQQKRL